MVYRVFRTPFSEEANWCCHHGFTTTVRTRRKTLQSYYNSMTHSKQISLTQGSIYSNMIRYQSLISKPISKAEAKEQAARKHSEAERRRRLRINGQYAELRKILPNLVKIDKASVLGKTIKTVRELQRTVKELKPVCRVHEECVFPSEANELRFRDAKGDGGMLKVTLSCEDKRGLMSDLARALRSVKARLVRAEIVPVGGRIKCVLWVQGLKGNAGLLILKRALNLVIDRSFSSGNSRFYH